MPEKRTAAKSQAQSADNAEIADAEVERSLAQNSQGKLKNAEEVIDEKDEKYQNLSEKYDRLRHNSNVRDLFKQYIIGFLIFALSADEIPPAASVILLIAIIVYLQFLTTHYRVDYIKDTALRWHNLFYAFSKKRLLGGESIEKNKETEPLPDDNANTPNS